MLYLHQASDLGYKVRHDQAEIREAQAGRMNSQLELATKSEFVARSAAA